MGEEDWLHVGRLFVFVNTEKHFLSKILKKEVKVRYLDENNVEVVKSVKKDIIPRIRKGIKVDSKEIYSISLPKLNITVATSDRKVYRKGETAYVIVWFLKSQIHQWKYEYIEIIYLSTATKSK